MPKSAKPLQKVLIANRGEIAVRVIRACKDAGIGSVAVYAEPDRDAVFVRLADEAHSLDGATPADSYLDIEKIVAVAEEVRGRLGPPGLRLPRRERRLRAGRHRRRAGVDRPAAEGDREPRRQGEGQAHRGAGERAAGPRHQGPGQGRRRDRGVREGERPPGRHQGRLRRRRSRPQGRPHHRGDPRRLRLRRPRGRQRVRPRRVPGREVPRQAAPRRDPVPRRPARQRRGGLDPRLLLQRRNQKLVEEAPAPFLTDDQVSRLYESSKAILREAEYVGAGTCEFLVAQDGTISFLEVNTRLQVEHCVSEEVTGLDLVREMFRIAAGEELGYDDPKISGHSIEFRINAEDGGANFMPAPGTLTRWSPAERPGRPARRRLRGGRDHPGRLRLPDRQADRLRPRPHPGARALAPCARRSSSSTACRP